MSLRAQNWIFLLECVNYAEIVVYDNVYDDADMYDAGKVLIYVSLVEDGSSQISEGSRHYSVKMI